MDSLSRRTAQTTKIEQEPANCVGMETLEETVGGVLNDIENDMKNKDFLLEDRLRAAAVLIAFYSSTEPLKFVPEQNCSQNEQEAFSYFVTVPVFAEKNDENAEKVIGVCEYVSNDLNHEDGSLALAWIYSNSDGNVLNIGGYENTSDYLDLDKAKYFLAKAASQGSGIATNLIENDGIWGSLHLENKNE